jgi:hypothetical protein
MTFILMIAGSNPRQTPTVVICSLFGQRLNLQFPSTWTSGVLSLQLAFRPRPENAQGWPTRRGAMTGGARQTPSALRVRSHSYTHCDTRCHRRSTCDTIRDGSVGIATGCKAGSPAIPTPHLAPRLRRWSRPSTYRTLSDVSDVRCSYRAGYRSDGAADR